MCTTCGCGPAEDHHHHDHDHHHGHDHHHHHHHEEHHHKHEKEKSGKKVVIEEDILQKNARIAAGNRRVFVEKGIFVLNLVSSPGSGKTTLLERTLRELGGKVRQAVVEGDQQTDNDAVRIAATGVPVKQVNTGAGCHLDAHMVWHAAETFDLDNLDLLFIENVGNLVCPASFDLGEHHKVALLSVTEGEDKPLKYPNMFNAADVVILNKTDLLPYVDFDTARCLDYIRRVNPDATVFQLSARTGEGLDAWYDWLLARGQK